MHFSKKMLLELNVIALGAIVNNQKESYVLHSLPFIFIRCVGSEYQTSLVFE